MVLNWFFKNEFEKFYAEIERVQKLIQISEKDLLIDHFVELRAHFKQIEKIYPILIKLYLIELDTIHTLSESNYKQRLEKYALELQKLLIDFESWIKNAVLIIDDVLKIRMLARCAEQKHKLERVILHMKEILDTAQRDAFSLVKLEKERKRLRSLKKPLFSKRVGITGKLNNGWTLNNIQNVIIELGGKVEENPGGAHPYKIIFPRYFRAIPLASSTPPFLLVKEVNHATGVDNKILIASFYQGELVAA